MSQTPAFRGRKDLAFTSLRAPVAHHSEAQAYLNWTKDPPVGPGTQISLLANAQPVLAFHQSMHQEKLVFAPQGIVDLGPVQAGGSNSRWLAINGITHAGKCRSHSNGQWVCFNEFLAARIGTKMHVPIPDFTLIQFRGHLASTETWFCSRKVGHRPADARTFSILANKDQLAPLILFDLWLCNSDRKSDHVIAEALVDGTEHIYAIDHGHTLFTNGGVPTLEAWGQFTYADLLNGIIDCNQIGQALERINAIGSDELSELVHDSPGEWIPDAGSLKSLCGLLLSRRERLPTIIQANLAQFRNIKRN